ncbi:MAG: cell division protein FtsQ/DivIB [Candidatus Kerfeldbacteria bacterium]
MRWNFRNKKIEENSESEKKPSFKNPLFIKSDTWKDFIIENKELIGLMLLLIISIIIYLILYSSIFKINKVELIGFDKISAKTISKEYIGTQLNNYRLLLFRQDNILLFNKEDFVRNINNNYSLESINIDKKFPHTLIITIQEKSPFLIYSTNNSKFYLDENGIISSKITDDTDNDKITIITNDANEEASANETIFSNDKIVFILNVVEKLPKIDSINVTSYSIPNKISYQLNVNVEQGYSIYFDMNKDINEQTNKLRRILDESESGDAPTEYIDLRIGERVYIK